MSTRETLHIGLRNKRKPGNSWVDNEIAVCFQAIVGADAVWIYHNLARQVQEQEFQPSVTFALREMAAWSGRSKDTVQRCLAVLELVGLIAVRRSTKSKATYDLLDVKELVVQLGAAYEPRRASFVLPEEVVERLKREVKALRERLTRKAAVRASSVAQSDRLPVYSLFLPGAQSDRSVALEDASVAPGAVATSYYKKEEKEEVKLSPLPPQAGAKEGGTLHPLLLTEAADEVMRGCGWSDRRLRRLVLAQLRMATGLGEALPLAAARMIAAWAELLDAAADGLLRCAPYGPKKFIGLGLWNNRDAWPWDMRKLAMRREANVGVWRDG